MAIDLGPEGVKTCLAESGIAFMYAPRYHPAMKAVRPVRSALKVREGTGTPLSCPDKPNHCLCPSSPLVIVLILASF